MPRARSGATILPVDSEHNAIFQCLAGNRSDRCLKTGLDRQRRAVPRLVAATRWRAVTPEQAVAHPNWSMGAKISVDSATMMNKGLELIEAHHLFGLPSRPDRHRGPSAVGDPFAWSNLSTDRCSPSWAVPTCASRSLMRSPGPSGWRLRRAARSCRASARLTSKPRISNVSRRCGLARRALEAGGAAPIVLNAANEVAVAALPRSANRVPRHHTACRAKRSHRKSAATPHPSTMSSTSTVERVHGR